VSEDVFGGGALLRVVLTHAHNDLYTLLGGVGQEALNARPLLGGKVEVHTPRFAAVNTANIYTGCIYVLL